MIEKYIMQMKILLAGDGGQGIQTIAKLISQTCFENNFFVSEIPNFGLEQRGGVSLEYLIISDKEIIYPKFTDADIILIMSDQAKLRIKNYELKMKKKKDFFKLEDYLPVLQKNQISKQSHNIFFLGILGKILADRKLLDLKKLEKSLEKKLVSKSGWEDNKKSFKLGLNKYD